MRGSRWKSDTERTSKQREMKAGSKRKSRCGNTKLKNQLSYSNAKKGQTELKRSKKATQVW